MRAIRWASDRIGGSGIIGFVTNAGFVDTNTADGLRKCLADEFSSIYVFHLRGNQRTAGELSRKEGGKIFGGGSRAPIAISLLVKNPRATSHGHIKFCDIGDYLTREEKLRKISAYSSIDGIAAAGDWKPISPDIHGDWIKQRNDTFSTYIAAGDKKGEAPKVFENFTLGVVTARDSWCFNSSKSLLESNVKRMVSFYESERDRFNADHKGLDKKARAIAVDKSIVTDPSKISWSRALKQDLVRDKPLGFDKECLVIGLYRPFTKQWMYFNRRLNEMVYQVPRLFPTASFQNKAIMVKQRWTGDGQLALMINKPPEFQIDGGAQCFPLYLYHDGEDDGEAEKTLFSARKNKTRAPTLRDAITDAGLAHFTNAYLGEKIGKEDLFYYVYGLLHSPEYRERFADNLGRELPRIPRVKTAPDFWAFSKAGRALAELHVNYESVPMYANAKVNGGSKPGDYRVEKMRYGKDKDRTTLHYNDKITITGIPLEAYDYVVNGKPALDWVVERQCVKTDRDSGIVNDANDWAVETMKNPKYPLELFLRVITVSLETMKIVKALPALDILE